jgi:hypothetical protein
LTFTWEGSAAVRAGKLALDDEKKLQYRIECNYFSADLADSAAADRTLSFRPRSSLIYQCLDRDIESPSRIDHIERLPRDVTFTGIAPTTGRKFKPHGPFTSTAAIFGVEVELNQMCAGMR